MIAATQAACNSDEPSFLQSVENYYDHAASLSDVQPHTLAHLRAVDSVLRVTFPIEVENGKYEVIEGKIKRLPPLSSFFLLDHRKINMVRLPCSTFSSSFTCQGWHSFF